MSWDGFCVLSCSSRISLEQGYFKAWRERATCLLLLVRQNLFDMFVIKTCRMNENKIVQKLQPEVFLKTSQNSQENTCTRVFFFKSSSTQACNFIKKETLARGFSGEFCEFFKNTFFTEHLWATASDCWTSTKRVSYLQSFLLTEMQT